MMMCSCYNLHQQEQAVLRLYTQRASNRMSSELNFVLGLSHIASLPMHGLMLSNKYVIIIMGYY